MATLAREAGFDTATIVPTDGHPGVFATMDNGAKRTLALYFMYDVKQFDPAEWSSPPLEATIVDKPGFGRAIVGRGAVNQKGPEATVLAALHAMRAAKAKFPVNLVLVAEGEEEIGSPNFHQIVQRPDDLRRAQEIRGHLHSRELAGHERQRLRQPGLERHHRAGAGGERRQVGSRAQGRHSLQPESERRLAGLASAGGAEFAGDAGWQYAGDRWLVRERPAAHGKREGVDCGSRAQRRRAGAEEAARHQSLDRRPALPTRRSSVSPRNRR